MFSNSYKISSASLTESKINYGYMTFRRLRSTGILHHFSCAYLCLVVVVMMP